MKALITTFFVIGFILSQTAVFSQERTPVTSEPIKVTKSLLTKMAEDIKYCILQTNNRLLTDIAREGYLRNLAFVVSDIFEIKDMPRKLKGASKEILDNAVKDMESIKMAAGYYRDKIDDKKTPQNKKDKYQIKLDRLQIIIDEYNSKLVFYDAYYVGSVTYNLGTSYLGNHYTLPVFFYGEKALYPTLSIGGYIRYFMETNRYSTPGEEWIGADTTIEGRAPLGIVSHDTGNRIKCASFGVRGSYHLSKLLKYNAKKWDLYGSATLGYTHTSKPKEFGYLKEDLEDFKPSKKGINGGLAAGARYFMDNNMGFFLEIGFERVSFFTGGFSYRLVKDEERKKMKQEEKSKKKKR